MRTLLITVVLALALGLGLYLQQRQTDAQSLTSSPPAELSKSIAEQIPVPAASERTRGDAGSGSSAPETDSRGLDGDLLRSDSAYQGLFFSAERGLLDLAGEMRKARQRIDSGAAGGYFDLARVIGNCVLADETTQLAADGVDPALAGGAWSQELQRLTEECKPVLAALPEGLSAAEWQLENLRTAAGEGDPLAALELAIDHTPGDQSYADVFALAQVVAQSGDYRGYFLVADFLTEFHDPTGADINEPRAMRWSLLGCRRSPLCEPEILEAQLALDYTPAEVEAFRDFAIDQERRIAQGERLDLEEGWLPLNEGS